MSRVARLPVLIAAVAVVLMAGVGIALVKGSQQPTTVTAAFANPIGVFEGNPVTILGVQVGKVTKLEPEGTFVRVTMELQDGITLPAGVQAAVVQQSLVNSRAVALTPAYTGGAELPDGVTIGLDRTFAPVELDEILVALQDLSTALGPDGANADGSVNDFLRVGAGILDGEGAQANRTVTQLAGLLGTLDTNRDDVAAIVTNLAQVLNTLAASNATVTAFERNLAVAASTLADEREMFGAATKELGIALGQLATLVRDHRGDLGADVQALARISDTLIAHQRDLMETLDVLPLGLANVKNAINPQTGRLDVQVPSEDFTPALCQGILSNSVPGAATLTDLLLDLPGVGELTQESCEQILGALLPVLGELAALAPAEAMDQITGLIELLPLTGLSPQAATAPTQVPFPDLGLSELLRRTGDAR